MDTRNGASNGASRSNLMPLKMKVSYSKVVPTTLHKQRHAGHDYRSGEEIYIFQSRKPFILQYDTGTNISLTN